MIEVYITLPQRQTLLAIAVLFLVGCDKDTDILDAPSGGTTEGRNQVATTSVDPSERKVTSSGPIKNQNVSLKETLVNLSAANSLESSEKARAIRDAINGVEVTLSSDFLALYQQIPPGTAFDATVKALCRKLGAYPNEVFQNWGKLQSGMQHDHLIHLLTRCLSSASDANYPISEILSQIASSNSSELNTKMYLDMAITEYARENPLQVKELVHSFPDVPGRANLIASSITPETLPGTVEEAVAVVSLGHNLSEKAALLTALEGTYRYHNPKLGMEVAMKLAENNPNLEFTVKRSFSSWVSYDLNAALKWLGQLDSAEQRDALIAEATPEIVNQDRKVAQDWIGSITNTELRERLQKTLED